MKNEIQVLEPHTDTNTRLLEQSIPERLNAESLKVVVQNYLRYYAAGVGHTARAKRYDLQHFLLFLAASQREVDKLQVSDWTMQATKNFIDSRLELGEAPATVSRRLATLKHFGRTLAERVPGFINPAREVKGPVLQMNRPNGLAPEEVELLRSAAKLEVEERKYSFLSLRNQFLLEILLATGLRADEVRLLVFSQVSEERDWLKNVKTKGKKFRNVYLDTEIRDYTEKYLIQREEQLRRKFPIIGTWQQRELGRLPVLLSFHKASIEDPKSLHLSPKTIWRIISNFGKKAQLLLDKPIGNLHPHKLRHTFAHGLLDSSKDVRLVAQALGHSDVRTTMRYTERSDQEIAAAMEKRLSSTGGSGPKKS